MKPLCLLAAIIFCLHAGCAAPRTKARWDDASVRKKPAAEESRDECLKSIRRARLDARAGTYRMYLYGPGRYEDGFARFLQERLRAMYGIELIIYGPGSDERDRCYSNEMDKIIYNTFGPGILADVEQEARELYRSE